MLVDALAAGAPSWKRSRCGWSLLHLGAGIGEHVTDARGEAEQKRTAPSLGSGGGRAANVVHLLRGLLVQRRIHRLDDLEIRLEAGRVGDHPIGSRLIRHAYVVGVGHVGQ